MEKVMTNNQAEGYVLLPYEELSISKEQTDRI